MYTEERSPGPYTYSLPGESSGTRSAPGALIDPVSVKMPRPERGIYTPGARAFTGRAPSGLGVGGGGALVTSLFLSFLIYPGQNYMD